MTELPQIAQSYFRRHFDVDPDALVSPIEPQRPAGGSLRGNGVYSAIKEARREDDPTLPQGPWTFELKRADWDKVGTVVLEALAKKTKDLQLAAWLLEAQVHRTGFEGIGACVALMQTLCERYWNDLHPAPEDGDRAEPEGVLEHRVNIIRWVDEKLLPVLRQVPITALGRGGREYHWADWEQAKRNEQIRAAQAAPAGEPLEGPALQELMAALAGTPTEAHARLHTMLQEALASIADFNGALDALCGDEAPHLNALGALLEQIRLLVASELHKRGVQLAAASSSESSPGRDSAGTPPSGGAGGADGGSGPIRDRADAYARLAQAADFLAHIEPHSPAPYLVQRAIQWGNLNTAELYHELFVKFGGQLSIFELLGLQRDAEVKDASK